MAKGLIIGAAIAGAVVIGGIGMFGFASSIKHTGVVMEQGLSTGYQDDQVELDTGVKEIKEAVGISNIKFANVDKVIRDGLSGTLAATIDPKTGGRSPFMIALQAAIPNVDASIYDRIIDKDLAFREHFKQTQIIFRDKIRDYQTWQNDGLIQPMFIRMMGFPSDNLEARIGTQVVHRQAALDQMKVLVTSVETDTAFQTGHEEGIDLPGAPAPDKK
ncbi:MAG: hypothetical protein P4L53_23000 [Candidatus Obscuribacterales bacterium]|nr:hypothetical protein [Candidatus Obscuribacterales bacterium]